jgi:hypothetical protein
MSNDMSDDCRLKTFIRRAPEPIFHPAGKSAGAIVQ